MSILYIDKDVTTVTTGVVCHGVNCQGVMGSGVAKAIRNKWPIVYTQYKEFVDTYSDKKQLLGATLLVNVSPDELTPDSLFVSNMFSQLFYGSDGHKYADINAIETSLSDTLRSCQILELPLYMPRVGCGLGGLQWKEDVQPIVDRLHQRYQVDIFVCDVYAVKSII